MYKDKDENQKEDEDEYENECIASTGKADKPRIQLAIKTSWSFGKSDKATTTGRIGGYNADAESQ